VVLSMARGRKSTQAPRTARRKPRPVGEARTLVAEGLPLHEVARRTGLARDALMLMAHRRPS